MKTLALVLVVLLLVTVPRAAGQGQQPEAVDLDQLMTDFGRAASGFGVRFVIVHLNDLTTDALFEVPLKYSLRAQARTATMFYVEGAANDDIELSTDFRIQQGAEHFQARTVDISNFAPGAQLSAGDSIRGIIASEGRFDFRRPIHVYYGGLRVTFEFPPSVLAQITGS
jgi:hypothetical protein